MAATGHSHPRVVAAIAEQAQRLFFYSTAVVHPLRTRLAAELAGRCPDPLGRVFFCNSGAEANENALHLARKATGRTAVASVTGGWHGRTVATLACCDGERYEAGARRAGMALSARVRFNDVSSLDAVLDDTMAALLIEPVQGMAGARDCSAEFLEAARRICTDRGIALLFDEVQCGVGRSGAFTAAELYGVLPDAITMAKGLGSGYPIGAVVAGPALTEASASVISAAPLAAGRWPAPRPSPRSGSSRTRASSPTPRSSARTSPPAPATSARARCRGAAS